MFSFSDNAESILPRYTATPHGTLLTTLNLNSPSFYPTPETVYDESTNTSFITAPKRFLTNAPMTPRNILSRREKVLAGLQALVKYGSIIAFVIGTWIIVEDCFFNASVDEPFWGLNPLGIVPAVVAVALVAAATVHLLRAAFLWCQIRSKKRSTANILRSRTRDWFKDLPSLPLRDLYSDVEAAEEGIVLVSPSGWESFDHDNVERGDGWASMKVANNSDTPLGEITRADGGLVGKAGLRRPSTKRRGSGGRLMLDPIEESDEESESEENPYATRESEFAVYDDEEEDEKNAFFGL
ncbi:hypothetical protein DFH27DRAFT_528827 [Peziza echinospora]|nr:hypothetical protein DFH27DRAFT_528827 [Peziza echinospora]